MNNKKGKNRRKTYNARQEREGKNVVLWIIMVLIVLALCYLGYMVVTLS